MRTLRVDPVIDYRLAFTPEECREVLCCPPEQAANLPLTFKMAHLRDVSILGSSGVTVSRRSGKVLHLDARRTRMHPNWVIARPLSPEAALDTAIYINLLGVRRGHRQFAHFFLDTLVPLTVYLKHWHDPGEPVVCLVREDLSAIQRDAFRFLEKDFAGIRFQALPENRKIDCARSIYIAYQNPHHGRDNWLERESLLSIRDLFQRHYGVGQGGGQGDATPGQGHRGSRVYVSRNDAALRRTINEEAVMDILSRHGFSSHVTGRMAFRQQAELFSGAEAVVAVHGSGLANLMFCRPGTVVIEVFSADFRDDSFIKLARAMGLDYHFLISGEGNSRQDVAIDVVALERMVADALRA
ncbi:MAG: glycosyltransferase family 61 protein [Nitrospirota bacterium]|nr:glycosyltransferase family 61 protein [Nitrospirota bacterium]